MYGPNHYYTTRYSPEELQYSGNIPYWLHDFLEVENSSLVLDIGCAYGTLACLSSLWTSSRVTVLDKLRYLLPAVENLYHLMWVEGDIERDNLPWWGIFNVVILTEVLEHFNFHPRHTLAKIKRMMRPGGILLVSTPDAESRWGRIRRYKSLADIPDHNPSTVQPWLDEHIWQYTEGELRQVFYEAGFTLDKLAYSQSTAGRHFNCQFSNQSVGV